MLYCMVKCRRLLLLWEPFSAMQYYDSVQEHFATICNMHHLGDELLLAQVELHVHLCVSKSRKVQMKAALLVVIQENSMAAISKFSRKVNYYVYMYKISIPLVVCGHATSRPKRTP